MLEAILGLGRVPADARVVGLRAGKQRLALNFPPASAQCGYATGRAF
jgi:hypothetical protein